jgi:hypothetical protein
MRIDSGHIVARFQISHLLGEAYGRDANVTTAINGVVKSVIWPVNPDVFQAGDDVPSSLKDSISNKWEQRNTH